MGNDTTDPNASARVDKIVELAEANGGGFVPEYDYTTIFGEQVTGQLGVLLFPDRNTTDDNPFDKQPLIIGVELAKLGDRVWLDSDADGIQDAGENGIEGVTVNLLADTDNDGQIDDVVHTTTTDADGNYHFEVIAGDYVVEFEQPEGFEVSPANQGTDDTVDSDGLISDVVTLSSGESNPTIDQGFYQTASLGDFVFEDSNADGIQDAGETGIGGVEVTLLADTDNDGNIDDVVDTATTAPDGSYEFTGLTPGVEYQVEFTQPSGFDSVSPRQQGGDPALDSDGLLSDVVVLASGENNPTIDAGFFNTAGLGDFVFEDTNGNGIQDSGEAGVEGVEVQLQNPDGTPVTDGNGDPITTTTDANGFYSFEGLTPGEYKVKFVAPDGFKFTTPNVGDDDTIDSDADPTMDGMTETVILESGDFNGTLDAGLVQPASLGDFVFEDSNANGIQDAGEVGIAGVEVKLLADTDNDGLIDDVVGITTTSADGSYLFPSLAPGVEYKVMFSQPGGFDGVSPRQAGNDPSIDSDGLMSDVVVLASGEFNPTIDAGFFKTAGLGDFVFEDTNGNGIQDSGEAGVSGVEVQLQNPDGTPVTDGNGDPITTTTDADGEYAFTGLTPGEYKVTFVAPEGFEFTTPNVGDDNAVDSDADPDNGMTETVILESGDFNGTLDAGLIRLIPDIDIEKFTNGVDADTPDAAAEIIVGDTVTWTYEVTNTGDVPFDESEILVTDDQEGTITDIIDQADGDNTLAPGETWIYQKTGTAQDLSTATNNVIDFETDGEGNALPAGTVIDDEYQNLGLTISATKFGAMIFDSANPTGGDFDLATDSEGNILIISEDGDSNDPDDNAGGGVITLDLDNPVDFNSINLVDIEETGGEVRTTDSDGNVVTTAIPAPGDGSLQTLNINDSDVVKIEVELVGSGAISGLDFDTFSDGIYKNIGTVVADGVEDSDHSHYVSLTPDPDIDIEKFVNGIDANSPDEYPELNPGSNVTFTYDVTNTGNVAFAAADVIVTDDNGTADDSNDDFNPEQVLDGGFNVGDVNQNNFLDVGETWKYSATDTVQELLTSETIHIEAEDFYELHGYEIEYNDFASGHELIRLYDHQGFASTTFHGETGVYDVVIGYYDENDGHAEGKFKINGHVVDSWTFDQDLGSRLPNEHTFVTRTIEHISLENGDEITLKGIEDNYEFARFDYIKLVNKGGDIYENVGTVEADGVSDSDTSGYVNPTPEPDISIEKFVEGIDANSPDEYPELTPGADVTFTYHVGFAEKVSPKFMPLLTKNFLTNQ